MPFLLSILLGGLVLAAAGMLPGLPALFGCVLLALLVLRPPALRGIHIFLWNCGLLMAALTAISLIPLPNFMIGGARTLFAQQAVQHIVWLQEYAATTAVGAAALDAGPLTLAGRLSLNYTGTVRFLGLFGCAWAGLWLAAGLTPRQKRALLWALVGIGTIVAALGILGRTIFPQGETLLWFITAEHGEPTGPFVNRNHFALFCAMLVPAALSLVASPGLRRLRPAAGRRSSIAQRTRPGNSLVLDNTEFEDEDAATPPKDPYWQPPFDGRRAVGAVAAGRLLAAICTGLLASAVFVSLSRSGMLALAAGAGAAAVLWIKARPVVATLAVGLGLTVVLGLLWWPTEDTRARIATLQTATETSSAQMRFERWRDTIRIWRKFPVAGSGMDSFRTVYPVYKSANSRKSALHSENEYLQILAEGGLIGAGITLAFLSVLIGYCIRRLFAGADTRHPAVDEYGETVFMLDEKALTRIAVGAIAAILVHSCFDFGLRIPLNALTAALLLGLALDAAPMAALRRSRTLRIPARIAAACLLSVTLVFSATCVGNWNLDRAERLIGAEPPEVIRGLKRAPCFWFLWDQLSRQVFTAAREVPTADGHSNMRHKLVQEALACLRLSVDYNSNNYRAWRALAATEHAAGNRSLARRAAERTVALRSYLRSSMRKYIEEP